MPVVELQQAVQRIRGQHRVGVEEEQQVPAGRSGADVTGPGLAGPAGRWTVGR
jgi:hypothetical protein